MTPEQPVPPAAPGWIRHASAGKCPACGVGDLTRTTTPQEQRLTCSYCLAVLYDQQASGYNLARARGQRPDHTDEEVH